MKRAHSLRLLRQNTTWAYALEASGLFLAAEGSACRRLDFKTGKFTPVGKGQPSATPMAVLGEQRIIAVVEETVAGPFTPSLSRRPLHTLVALDRATGEPRERFETTHPPLCVQASAQQLAVLSEGGTLEVFSASGGRPVATYSGVDAFGWLGNELLRVCEKELNGRTRLAVSILMGRRKSCMLWVRDGLMLWLSRSTRQGQVFDATTGASVADFDNVLGWGPSGRTLAIASGQGEVSIIDFSGAVKTSFTRARKEYPDFTEGADTSFTSSTGWLLLRSGAHLEAYHLAGDEPLVLPPRAAPRPKAVPPTPNVPVDANRTASQAYWADPDNAEALHVWADLLAEHADPRGPFIALRLAGEPTESLEKKLGGKLVGPARPFIRQWWFGQNGLVERLVCEAQQLVMGFEAIAALNPRLSVIVTSLRKQTQATIAALARLPLGQIQYLSFNNNGLTDASMQALAPGLAQVRHLSVADNRLTASGIAGLGEHLQAIEVLHAGYCEQAEGLLAGPTLPGLKVLYVADAPEPSLLAALLEKWPALKIRPIHGDLFSDEIAEDLG